jgi:HEAT repeat protein
MAFMKPCMPYSFQLLAGQMMLPDQSRIVAHDTLFQADIASSSPLCSRESSFTLAGDAAAPLAGAFKGQNTLGKFYRRHEGALEKRAFPILSNEAKERVDEPHQLSAQLYLEVPGSPSIRAASGGSKKPVLRCASSSEIGGHITALKSENRGTRFWAARGLAKLDDARAVLPLLKAMGDPDDEIRTIATKGLREFSPARVIGPLIKAFGDANIDVRNHAAWIILKFGRDAVSPLIAALRDKDKFVRARAALALGGLGDARAVSPLITALQEDTNTDVRQNAAEALGRLGNARAVTPLLTALEDRNIAVRGKAADALGELGDARAIASLIKALEDKNAAVRGNAAWALGELGDARAVDALIQALSKGKGAAVRAGAAKALGELGDVRAAVPLVTALGDKESTVQSFAAEAIEALADVDRRDHKAVIQAVKQQLMALPPQEQQKLRNHFDPAFRDRLFPET